jgi:cobalt-zinc-cadmium efflux system outer membrane protein
MGRDFLRTAIGLFLAAGLAAQTLPDKATIEQAVQEALDRNLNLLAERYNLSIADARIVTAKLRPNPVFSAGLDYVDILGTGFNSSNAAGPSEYNVRTDFVLERGGKRERRIEVAEDARDVAKLQLLNTTRALVLDVQNAFVDVVAAKDNLQLARENLQAFQGIVGVNQTRVRAGDLAKVELVRTQVAALQFQSAVRQAESKLRVAANRL